MAWFLVEGEAAIKVASTIVPARSSSFLLPKMRVHHSQDLHREAVLFQPTPELQDRRLVRNRVLVQLQARKPPHRLDLVQRIFGNTTYLTWRAEYGGVESHDHRGALAHSKLDESNASVLPFPFWHGRGFTGPLRSLGFDVYLDAHADYGVRSEQADQFVLDFRKLQRSLHWSSSATP